MLGVLGRKEGKEGGRKLVLNICDLVMPTYAKEKSSVLDSDKRRFLVIIKLPKP